MVAVHVMRVVNVYDKNGGAYINVDLNEKENRKNVEFCKYCYENDETAVYHPVENGTLVEFMTERRYNVAAREFDKRIEEVVWTDSK